MPGSLLATHLSSPAWCHSSEGLVLKPSEASKAPEHTLRTATSGGKRSVLWRPNQSGQCCWEVSDLKHEVPFVLISQRAGYEVFAQSCKQAHMPQSSDLIAWAENLGGVHLPGPARPGLWKRCWSHTNTKGLQSQIRSLLGQSQTTWTRKGAGFSG